MVDTNNLSKYPESDFENSMDSEDENSDGEENIISQEFKDVVIKYIKYDDLIRKKMEEIKELKKTRKPLEEYILNYLENIKINQLELNDGRLKKHKTETKVPINNNIIKSALDKKINNPQVVQDIIKLVEEREKKVKVTLKRVRRKIPANASK